jgi:hypothetical protein
MGKNNGIHYGVDKSKIAGIFNSVINNTLEIEKLKEYHITYSTMDYVSTKNKYDILTNYNFLENFDNYFIIDLKNFPIEFIPFLKIIPIFKIHKIYEDFLSYNQFKVLDLKAELPEEYYYLTQQCIWDIKAVQEDDDEANIKYYIVGYVMGSLMNQNSDEFPLRGDVYIHIDYTGAQK